MAMSFLQSMSQYSRRLKVVLFAQGIPCWKGLMTLLLTFQRLLLRLMVGIQRRLQREVIRREPGSARKFIRGMHLLRTECEDKAVHFVQVSVLGQDLMISQQSIQPLLRRLAVGTRLLPLQEAVRRDYGNVKIVINGSLRFPTDLGETDVHIAQAYELCKGWTIWRLHIPNLLWKHTVGTPQR